MYAKVICSTHPRVPNSVIIWDDDSGIGRYLKKDGTLCERYISVSALSELLRPNSVREAIGLLKRHYKCPVKNPPDFYGDIRFPDIVKK